MSLHRDDLKSNPFGRHDQAAPYDSGPWIEDARVQAPPEPEHPPILDWRRPPHTVWWVIAVALVVIAVVQVTRVGDIPIANLGKPVLGQTTAGGAGGVFAFSGQLTKSTYGVFVVDVDTMTIWTYEYQPQKGCMRLACARTWRYDRYLEHHNICDLPPEAVEEMVEQQRAYRLDKLGDSAPED